MCLPDFEAVTTADGHEAISVTSEEITTLALFMTHYWEAELSQPVFVSKPPRLRFTFGGETWHSDMVTPITTRGFLVAAYKETAGAEGICFALERTTGPWQLVKHFRWLRGGPGELDNLTPGEACHLFRELEIGKRIP